MIWIYFKGNIYAANNWDDVRSLIWNQFYPMIYSGNNLQRITDKNKAFNKTIRCSSLLLEIKERTEDNFVRPDRLVRRAQITH